MTEPRPPRPRPTSEAELVELVRAIDVPAPESLHRKVDAMIATHSAKARRRARGDAARSFGLAPRIAAVGAIAAAILALVIAVSLGGGSSTLSVRDAAALTLSPATHGPPAERSDGRELTAAVEGVAFPYWGSRLGWHASGSRSDRVDDRTVRVVFYEDGNGRRVGYAIVGGPAPAQGTGGVVSHRDGTPYRLLTIEGAPVVTWLRHGHLCVLSGHGVSGATLLRLASWQRRAVAS